MNAEIIIVGNELSSCVAAFTAADVIANELKKYGVVQKSRYYVASKENDVVEAIKESVARYDITILTGCTVSFPPLASRSIAECAGLDIVENDEMFEEIKKYARRHGATVTDSARPYARIPRGAELLKCEDVPIPGYILRHRGKTVVVLSGCAENVGILCQKRFPDVFADSSPAGVTRRVGLINCTVSDAHREANRICELVRGVTASVVQSVAEINVDFHAEDGESVQRAVDLMENGSLSGSVYGVDTDMPTALVHKLITFGHKLATAESCTGGLVAKLITDIAGASEVFPGGIVSYANEVKMETLGVSSSTLIEHGAVSHQCAVQMADGVRKKMDVDWSIGITGLAGPGGGTPEKPVGLVYIAVASRRRTTVAKYNIAGDRETVRSTVAKYAMRSLLTRMMKH